MEAGQSGARTISARLEDVKRLALQAQRMPSAEASFQKSDPESALRRDGAIHHDGDVEGVRRAAV